MTGVQTCALPIWQVEPFLHELVAEPGVTEAVALSTCNRTELYLVADDPVEAESAVLALLARRAGSRPTELVEAIYVERNCDAARHLFLGTASLSVLGTEHEWPSILLWNEQEGSGAHVAEAGTAGWRGVPGRRAGGAGPGAVRG